MWLLIELTATVAELLPSTDYPATATTITPVSGSVLAGQVRSQQGQLAEQERQHVQLQRQPDFIITDQHQAGFSQPLRLLLAASA
ncbi:MAG: hypothetical protein WBR18_14440 [Anaerolineales bacterium]